MADRMEFFLGNNRQCDAGCALWNTCLVVGGMVTGPWFPPRPRKIDIKSSLTTTGKCSVLQVLDDMSLVTRKLVFRACDQGRLTYLGKSCSFCLPRVPFVNCRQFLYLVISLLVLRAGYGI